MIRKFLLSAALPLAALFLPCASPAAADDKPAAAKEATQPEAAEATKAEKGDAKEPAPAPDFPEFPEAVDIGGFGSDEIVERKDLPERGIIAFGPNDYQRTNGAHWETYVWPELKAKRWGKYQVRLTYTMNRASLGMQLRVGDLVVKKPLLASAVLKKMYLGTVYISQPGLVPCTMLTAPSEGSGFEIEELALIPTTEGSEVVQAEDGTIILNAKDATTWSETMRYEPKPEKNCLGYWTEPDDFAEWEFQVTKPGRYKVAVVHGCGSGNQGSEVEVKQADQSLKFTTQDTGGFQKWQEVQVGEIEIKAAGKQRLVIDPVNKKKAAVLDVQKVVLTPVG